MSDERRMATHRSSRPTPQVSGEVDRLLTAPNVITLIRLLCLPLYLYLLFNIDMRGSM